MDFLPVVAVISYLLATIAIISRIFHPKGPDLVYVLALGSIAIIAHTLSSSHLLYAGDTININLPNVISLVTLIISMTLSLIALRYKVNLLLPVVYGFAGIWQAIMMFLPELDQIALTSEKLVIFTHITIALIAYCILVIATLYSFQVSYINYKLKHKNLTAVNQLPPLMQVEHQLFAILAAGTLCLLISIMTGLIFLDSFFDKENLHKTVLSITALLMYSLILWGHHQRGWRGSKVLSLTFFATIILTLSYFGSRFVKEFLLS